MKMNGILLLRSVLWLAYPFAIFFGLKFMEPRFVAILLACALLARRGRQAARLLEGLSRVDRSILAGLLLVAVVTVLTNSEVLLRLYPAAMNLGMLLLFGLSLFYPPSMIERFARVSEPDLPLEGVVYTRVVTKIWCAFFLFNASIATVTAIGTSRENWALYNGLIAYLLMGALFAGEWVFRRYFLARTSE
jgi:uncharacterized membrane protein